MTDVEVLPGQVTAAESMHRRPDGVVGEWNTIPPEEWNVHQRVAEATGGWVTVANGISVAGGLVTLSGMWDICRGRYGRGVAKVIVGRTGDLIDGAVSDRLGTKSEPGAFVDASVDSALLSGGAVTLAAKRVIKSTYAAAVLGQQLGIAAENTEIHAAGGEPNPSRTGKDRMWLAWSGIAARCIQTWAAARGWQRTEQLADEIGRTAERGVLGLGVVAIQGYDSQRRALDGDLPVIGATRRHWRRLSSKDS
jgi:phosphatidylglycerophosphate synthase